FEQAVDSLGQSVRTWHEVGDIDGEAFTLLLLGHALSYCGRSAEGLTHASRAVDNFAETGNTWGRALALNDLGVIHMGRHEEGDAADCLEQSRDLWESLRDTWGLSLTLAN